MPVRDRINNRKKGGDRWCWPTVRIKQFENARKEAENINGKRKLNSAGVAAQFEILGENLDTCSKRNNNNNGIVAV